MKTIYYSNRQSNLQSIKSKRKHTTGFYKPMDAFFVLACYYILKSKEADE